MSIVPKIPRKSRTQKKYQGQIFQKNWTGGPRSRREQKFYEGVGVSDRGHRDLSNGVKIVTLRLLYLELNRILLKFLNLIFWS